MRTQRRLEPVLFLMLLAGCAPAKPEAPPEAAATQGAEQPAPAAELPPAPTPAAELPPAPTPAAAPPQFAAIVAFKVKDFEAWKVGFEAHADMRKQAGIVGHEIMRGADDPKLVVVYAPATDAEKLQAFFASADLKAAMKNSGVVGKPTIYEFKMIGAKMAPSKAPLVGVVVEYDTKDFAAFQQALDAQADARAAAGIVGWALGQGLAKPTQAYVYLQSDELAKLKKYLAAKETKDAFAKAGVHGKPTTTLVKEGEMTPYN